MIEKSNIFYFQYLKGRKTYKPTIVIESDDWGSIRIPNMAVHSDLMKKKIDVYSNPFNLYDTLENEEDLDLMHTTLENIFNDTGKKVIMTVNTVMANPNFDAIMFNNFRSYYFEEFIQTYKRYGYTQSWEKFQKLISDQYFMPQFHAREHVNVLKWLGLLRENSEDLLYAFDRQVFSISFIHKSTKKENLMASYWYENEQQNSFIIDSIKEGMNIFNNLFGFSSSTTIAPVGIWDSSHERCFLESGIKSIQSFLTQRIPQGLDLKSKYRYNGQKNDLGQFYFPRNVYFEPSTNQTIDWVSVALKQISRAFFFRKAAIISSHRVNYVGGLNPQLRNENILKFNILLRAIIKKWPSVQFISSDKLIEHA